MCSPEVHSLVSNLLRRLPPFGANINTDFILGMGKAEGNVTSLLDIGKVLSRNNIACLIGVGQRGESV